MEEFKDFLNPENQGGVSIAFVSFDYPPDIDQKVKDFIESLIEKLKN